MNWDQIEGKWKQFTGSARERWGKLTDNDWETIAGKKDQLVWENSGAVWRGESGGRKAGRRVVTRADSVRPRNQSGRPHVVSPHTPTGPCCGPSCTVSARMPVRRRVRVTPGRWIALH